MDGGWVASIGLIEKLTLFAVDHPPGHGDQMRFDLSIKFDFLQRVNGASGQRQIDRPPRGNGLLSHVRAALEDLDGKSPARQVDRQKTSRKVRRR